MKGFKIDEEFIWNIELNWIQIYNFIFFKCKKNNYFLINYGNILTIGKIGETWHMASRAGCFYPK